jgi:hypothetical protein
MRHVQIAGGLPQMEIDHFNPTLSGRARNAYANLMLSTRLCNNFKRDTWPLANQAEAGMRFLNPTMEMDYEEHLFEDPKTHELVGITPAGKYHIDALDLNNETFVWERATRAKYAKRRASSAILTGSFAELRELLAFVSEYFELFIPAIPPPPKSPKRK